MIDNVTAMWYVLNLLDGICYVLLFVLAIVLLRLCLKVIKAMVTPHCEHRHKFVHPLPGPLEITVFSQWEDQAKNETAPQSDEPKEGGDSLGEAIHR